MRRCESDASSEPSAAEAVGVTGATEDGPPWFVCFMLLSCALVRGALVGVRVRVRVLGLGVGVGVGVGVGLGEWHLGGCGLRREECVRVLEEGLEREVAPW